MVQVKYSLSVNQQLTYYWDCMSIWRLL